MTEAENLYHHITTHTPDGAAGKMFGCLCMKTPNGKAAVFFDNPNMVFKLPEPQLSEMLRLDGARIFDPSGTRPMKRWVELPFDYAEKWPELAKLAVDHVKIL